MIKALYRLFRLPNLLMIALTQYLLKFYIIEPVIKANLDSSGKINLINEVDFFLLVLSSVLIAAAGYIINDYYDMEADRINRPDKMVIGNKISERSAKLLYWIFNIIGVTIGFYLSYKLQIYKFGLFNLVVAMTLWLYSTSFKRQLISGNIVIAVLSAFVVIIVWLFDFFAFSKDAETIINMFSLLRDRIMPYALFAFLITFIREVIKDIEDMEGDSKMLCRTFPVVYGIKKTKTLLYITVAITIAIMTYVLYYIYLMNFELVFWYLLLTVELPLFYVIIQLYKAETKENYSSLSGIMKIIMFAGILSMQALQF